MALDISAKLRAIRDARGLSQEELARQLGVSFPTVNSWERGKSQPYPRHVHAIERLYLAVSREERKRLVLIVEDDEAAAMILEDYVSMALPEWSAVRVDNGYDAILKIGLLQPALVLLDIMMPDVDGLKVFARLKEMPELAGTRVVFVTAVTDEAILAQARAAEPFALLSKPLRRDEILATLRAASSS